MKFRRNPADQRSQSSDGAGIDVDLHDPVYEVISMSTRKAVARVVLSAIARKGILTYDDFATVVRERLEELMDSEGTVYDTGVLPRTLPEGALPPSEFGESAMRQLTAPECLIIVAHTLKLLQRERFEERLRVEREMELKRASEAAVPRVREKYTRHLDLNTFDFFVGHKLLRRSMSAFQHYLPLDDPALTVASSDVNFVPYWAPIIVSDRVRLSLLLAVAIIVMTMLLSHAGMGTAGRVQFAWRKFTADTTSQLGVAFMRATDDVANHLERATVGTADRSVDAMLHGVRESHREFLTPLMCVEVKISAIRQSRRMLAAARRSAVASESTVFLYGALISSDLSSTATSTVDGAEALRALSWPARASPQQRMRCEGCGVTSTFVIDATVNVTSPGDAAAVRQAVERSNSTTTGACDVATASMLCESLLKPLSVELYAACGCGGTMASLITSANSTVPLSGIRRCVAGASRSIVLKHSAPKAARQTRESTSTDRADVIDGVGVPSISSGPAAAPALTLLSAISFETEMTSSLSDNVSKNATTAGLGKTNVAVGETQNTTISLPITPTSQFNALATRRTWASPSGAEGIPNLNDDGLRMVMLLSCAGLSETGAVLAHCSLVNVSEMTTLPSMATGATAPLVAADRSAVVDAAAVGGVLVPFLQSVTTTNGTTFAALVAAESTTRGAASFRLDTGVVVPSRNNDTASRQAHFTTEALLDGTISRTIVADVATAMEHATLSRLSPSYRANSSAMVSVPSHDPGAMSSTIVGKLQTMPSTLPPPFLKSSSSNEATEDIRGFCSVIISNPRSLTADVGGGEYYLSAAMDDDAEEDGWLSVFPSVPAILGRVQQRRRGLASIWAPTLTQWHPATSPVPTLGPADFTASGLLSARAKDVLAVVGQGHLSIVSRISIADADVGFDANAASSLLLVISTAAVGENGTAAGVRRALIPSVALLTGDLGRRRPVLAASLQSSWELSSAFSTSSPSSSWPVVMVEPPEATQRLQAMGAARWDNASESSLLLPAPFRLLCNSLLRARDQRKLGGPMAVPLLTRDSWGSWVTVFPASMLPGSSTAGGMFDSLWSVAYARPRSWSQTRGSSSDDSATLTSYRCATDESLLRSAAGSGGDIGDALALRTLHRGLNDGPESRFLSAEFLLPQWRPDAPAGDPRRVAALIVRTVLGGLSGVVMSPQIVASPPRDIDVVLTYVLLTRNAQWPVNGPIVVMGILIIGTVVAVVLTYHQVERKVSTLHDKQSTDGQHKELLEVFCQRLPKPLVNVGMGRGNRVRHPKLVVFNRLSHVFIDLAGSMTLAKVSPQGYVRLLMYTFYVTDGVAAAFNLEKLQTVGDGIFFLGGLPTSKKNSKRQQGFAVLDAVLFAVNISIIFSNYYTHHPSRLDVFKDLPFEDRFVDDTFFVLPFRTGITVGPAFVGTVSLSKAPTPTCIGESVSMAVLIQRSAEPGGILLTRDARKLLSQLDRKKQFDFEGQQKKLIKSKTESVYTLKSARVSVAPDIVSWLGLEETPRRLFYDGAGWSDAVNNANDRSSSGKSQSIMSDLLEGSAQGGSLVGGDESECVESDFGDSVVMDRPPTPPDAAK